MSTAEVNGSTVFYLEFGDAELPPLVLLHGLYGDSWSVAPLAERLAERFHVIAPDALGHGRSSRPEGFVLEDQGRMLNGLVAALGYESTTLVGISMGSYLAEQAAILEPSRTSHLVLVVSKAQGMTSSVAAYAKRMGFDLGAATMEEAVELMASALWAPDTSPDVRAAVHGYRPPEMVELSPEERAEVERSLAGFDLRPGLPSVTAKTLVISGRYDGLNPPASGKEVASLIPGARFEVYEHSGHMLPFEETDHLVADITDFALGAA